MDEEFDEALKSLKIKMEKENRITVHFINNDYVGLSATMCVKTYNKHKQFIIFLQFFTRIIITIIVSTIIIIIVYLLLFKML
jgi:phosphotransferase system  glucose/maltose/N-acetylglucosamine-specific IIC component